MQYSSVPSTKFNRVMINTSRTEWHKDDIAHGIGASLIERQDRGHYLLWAELSRKEERITVSIHSTLADSSAAALLPNRAVRDARVIGSFRDSPSFHTP